MGLFCLFLNRELSYLIKKVTRSTVEKILGVSKTRANNILNKMIKDGILKKVGIGRTTMYSLK